MHNTLSPPPHRHLVLILAALTMIGPFSIDTYLPAFPAMAQGLHTTDVLVQQTLAAYLIPFAFMMLWHGALSDALGRRRVILVGLVLFLLSSLLCAFASSIEILLFGRVLQGLTAGTGVIVSRAMVRDLYGGAEAQKLMAKVSILFAVAPAIAPIIGGWILQYFDWHGIFFFLTGFSLVLFIACVLWLPETLGVDNRQSLHPVTLWHAYRRAFSHHEFRRLSLATALNFVAGFIYILASPVFLIRHLGVSSNSFGIMFVPVVLGMMVGSYLSGRTAGKISTLTTVKIGYALMASAATLNLIINLTLPPGLPWSLVSLPIYTCGMALSMPTLQLMALDHFPERRGLASSCMGVIQTGIMAIVAAVVVPLLWGSTLTLALGMVGFLTLGAGAFLMSRRTAVT